GTRGQRSLATRKTSTKKAAHSPAARSRYNYYPTAPHRDRTTLPPHSTASAEALALPAVALALHPPETADRNRFRTAPHRPPRKPFASRTEYLHHDRIFARGSGRTRRTAHRDGRIGDDARPSARGLGLRRPRTRTRSCLSPRHLSHEGPAASRERRPRSRMHLFTRYRAHRHNRARR